MEQSDQHAMFKELAEKIVQFFSHQIESNNSVDEAGKESLNVAIECIEQAYNIQRKPASNELVDMYKSYKRQQTAQPSGNPPDPTQLLGNLASTLFSQVGGQLSGAAAAAAAAANPTGQQQTVPPSGNQPNPTQLLGNLASSIFSQVNGQLSGAAAANAANAPNSANVNGQQPDHATSAQSTTSANNPQPSAPPRQRKRVTEAERLAAESFKNQGNDCMKQDKHKEAYDYYTQAIEIDDNNAVYYSNRAAALAKLSDHQAVIRDCQEAIEIDPNYSKAYGRMGLAFATLDNHLEAKKAYIKAVELDPTNESYQNNLNIAEEELAKQNAGNQAGVSTPQANVMGMLQSMMSNPQVMSLAMQSLQDPRIQGMFGLGGNANTQGGH